MGLRWAGISLKTQELYALVFICRYLDLFTRYVSLCAPRAAAYALSVISVVEGSMHKSQSLPCSLARYACGAGLDAGASLAREAVRCACMGTAECVIGRGARPSQRGRAGLRCAGSPPLAPLATRGCAALTRAVPQCGYHERAGARLGTVRRRSSRPPGRRGPAPGQVLLQPGPDERPALHAVRPQLVPLALPGHQGCDGACARERK